MNNTNAHAGLMYPSTTKKFTGGLRIHGLPYGYQSLWPSSLLCLLCDWSFLASAVWRSALHLLPSSHQTHTRSKRRKVRDNFYYDRVTGYGWGWTHIRVNLSFSSSALLQGQPGFSTSTETTYTLLLGTGITLPSQRPFWLILEKNWQIQSLNCSAESKESRCSLIPETFTPCSLPHVLLRGIEGGTDVHRDLR